MKRTLLWTAFILTLLFSACKPKPVEYSGNPLFDSPLTADPAVMVYNDTLYLFAGSDEAEPGQNGFVMHKWYIFSTADMVHWTNHGVKLQLEDFAWASHNAFAGHCVENHGKFWWYVPMVVKDSTLRVHEGFGIGVAVADHPLGPYKDASGKPVICDTTSNSVVLNIDPAVYVDDDTDNNDKTNNHDEAKENEMERIAGSLWVIGAQRVGRRARSNAASDFTRYGARRTYRFRLDEHPHRL